MANEFEDNYPVQERAKQMVQTRFNESEDAQNHRFNSFLKYYELYRGVQSERNYEGRANLFVPEPYAAVESIHARVLRSFAGVRAKPQSENDVKAAEAIETLLEYQTRVFNFKQAFADAAKDAWIYGTGFLKVSWFFSDKGKKDHPMVEAIDPMSYFFDPNATDRSKSRWEIHKTQRTIEELKANPNYFNLDLVEDHPPQASNSSFIDQRDSVKNSAEHATAGAVKDKYDIIEYWGKFSPEEDGDEEEYLIVVANNNYVIRLEKNPYADIFEEGIVDETMMRPFVVMKDTDVPHEFYGIGMIEPMEKLVEELNDTRNQRMDNVTLNLDRMWAVLDSADIDPEEMVMKPGGIIHMAIPNGVTPLPTADMTQSSYNEEQIIKQDIQKAIGLPDVATGSLAGSEKETAATILSLQESANIRFDVKISNFADAVRHAYSLLLTFNQAFLDRKTVIRIEGEQGFEFPEIDKKAIRGKFDVDVLMDTQMNKIVRRQEAMQLYGALAANPMINQQVNTKELLESTDRKNLEEWMTPPPMQPQPPEQPKKSISVSLKGDLNDLESDDIAVIMGAKEESADPLLRQEYRQLMKGIMPEEQEADLKVLETREKLMEEKRLAESKKIDAELKAQELALKEREMTLREKQESKAE